MFYLYEIDFDTIHGPFTSRQKAYAYAHEVLHILSYRIITDKVAQQQHQNTRTVLVERERR